MGLGAAVSNTLRRPTAAALKNEGDLLAILQGFYIELLEARKPRSPNTVPALKAVGLSLHVDLRKTEGDAAGELGPRACIVTGGTTVLDAGRGVFAWDATSTAADDGVNTFQVGGIDRGRWRRIV